MVGKKELLQWASQASGRIVTEFDELKDGDVLLRCMKETWPAAYDRCRRKGQPRSVSGNFELMGNMFEHLELPKSVLDTRGDPARVVQELLQLSGHGLLPEEPRDAQRLQRGFHPSRGLEARGVPAGAGERRVPAQGRRARAPRRKRPENVPRSVVLGPIHARHHTPRAVVLRPPRPRRRAGVGVRRGAQGRGRALANEEANRRALLAATSTSPSRRRRAGASGPGGSTQLAAPNCPPAPAWNRAGNDENAAPPVRLSLARGPRCSRRGTRAGSRRAPPRTQLASARDSRRRRVAFAAWTRSSAAAGIEPATPNRRRPPAAARGSTGRRRSTARATGTWLRVVPRQRRTEPGGRFDAGRRRRDFIAAVADADAARRRTNVRKPRTTTTRARIPRVRRLFRRFGPSSPRVRIRRRPKRSKRARITPSEWVLRRCPEDCPRRRRSSSSPAPTLPVGSGPTPTPPTAGDAAGGGALRAGAAASAVGRVKEGAGLAGAKVRRGARREGGEVHRVDARRRGRRARAHRRAGASARRRTQRGSARAYLHELRLVAEEVAAARVADDAAIDGIRIRQSEGRSE